VLANSERSGCPASSVWADVDAPGDPLLQAVDLSLKVGSELLAFTQVNGLPGDASAISAAALADYAGEARAAGWRPLICFDAFATAG